MRIGAILKADVAANFYRVFDPVMALGQRGHDVHVVELDARGDGDFRSLHGCDVVHVYRRSEPGVVRVAAALRRAGVGITWDNDDDLRLLPPESPHYAQVGGRMAHEDFKSQTKILRQAHVVTTTSEVLADRYLEAGAGEVVKVENYLSKQQYTRRRRHEGIVVGWVAGNEHIADARALDISGILRDLMERHPQVRVVTIGVKLDLPPGRYTHHAQLPFPKLKEHTRCFDVGLAPLADIPMSYARSNVKVKEYSAASVPWIASDRGPYRGLGPSQGGLVVDDDQWSAALDALVTSRMHRLRLRRRAVAWARTQRLTAHLDEWTAVFEHAIALAKVEAPVPPRATASARR